MELSPSPLQPPPPSPLLNCYSNETSSHFLLPIRNKNEFPFKHFIYGSKLPIFKQIIEIIITHQTNHHPLISLLFDTVPNAEPKSKPLTDPCRSLLLFPIFFSSLYQIDGARSVSSLLALCACCCCCRCRCFFVFFVFISFIRFALYAALAVVVIIIWSKNIIKCAMLLYVYFGFSMLCIYWRCVFFSVMTGVYGRRWALEWERMRVYSLNIRFMWIFVGFVLVVVVSFTKRLYFATY